MKIWWTKCHTPELDIFEGCQLNPAQILQGNIWRKREQNSKWQDLNFQSESEIEEHYTEVKVSEGQRHENIQYSNLSWRLFLHFWLPQYDFIVHTLNISKTINWISILYKYWHLSRHNIKGVRQKQTWNYNHYQGVSKLPPPLKRVMISIAIVSQWCNTFRIVLCFFI